MNPQLQAILAELKQRLTELYGERLERLVLYGSQARGDAEPDSDIDVLVVLHGPEDDGTEIERTGDLASEISLRYDTVIALVFVSAADYEKRRSPLLINVRREGIAL